MNFDGDPVADRPMDGLSLFQMDGSARGKAKPVQYFATEELTLFNGRENAARL
jgi:hypothetical protein